MSYRKMKPNFLRLQIYRKIFVFPNQKTQIECCFFTPTPRKKVQELQEVINIINAKGLHIIIPKGIITNAKLLIVKLPNVT